VVWAFEFNSAALQSRSRTEAVRPKMILNYSIDLFREINILYLSPYLVENLNVIITIF
jgi:hypothetical protein